MKLVVVLCLGVSVVGAVLADTKPAFADAKPAGDAHAARYAVVDKIALPDGSWDYAMIDANARRLYLGRNPGVMALDLETKKITDVLAAGAGVHAALPIGDTGLVVSTNGHNNTAIVFDGTSGKIKGTIPTGKGPDAAAFDTQSGLVAVADHRAGTVTLIDPKSASVAGSIEVGGELEFIVAPGDGTLYVNVVGAHAIAVLDIAARRKIRSINLTGCTDPSGLAYDSADDLLIAVCDNGVTKFVHATEGADVATLTTGKGSDGVILDAQRHLVFVPAGTQGVLSVIAFDSRGMPRVVQSLGTHKGARLGALDPKTGRIYLPAADMGPPVPPSPWPSVIPGTVHMVVVGPEADIGVEK